MEILFYIAVAVITFFVSLFMTAYDSSETNIEYQSADMATLSLRLQFGRF